MSIHDNALVKNYHVKVSWPKRVKVLLPPHGTNIKLNYGSHAKRSAIDDRHGDIYTVLPTNIVISRDTQIFEATLSDNDKVLVKFGVRLRLDDIRDLVMIVMADGFVKTVWINVRSDKHDTLRKELYAR